MHVLILNQTFYPDVAATGQLMWDLAKHLEKQGHRVTAVTSRNFYGTDRRHELAYERIGNIEIHRLGGTAFGKKNFFARMADFASFYLAAIWFFLRKPAPDVVLALTSPPMISTLPMLFKKIFRTPEKRRMRLVYHIMDLYPDAVVAHGMSGKRSLAVRICGWITRKTLKSSDRIIVLGRDMRDRIIGEYNAPAERIEVVTPWGDSELLTPMEKADNPMARELGLVETFNVVYSGNLGNAHDFNTLLLAVEGTANFKNLRWLFIGSGTHFPRLREELEKKNWNHVRILPFQDRSVLCQSLNLADVHLVSQLPTWTGIVVPSKLFGILAVGKPSIMVGPADVECSRVLCDHQAGYVVPNGDAQQLIKVIQQLQGNPELGKELGRRARQAFLTHYDRPIACGRISDILQQAVNQ